MNEIERFLRSVERLNLALAALAVLAGLALFGGESRLWSLCIGAATGLVNARAIAFIGRRIAAASDTGRAGFFALFLLKFAILAGLVFAFIVVVKVDVLPFLVGLSTPFAAMTAVATRHMLAPSVASDELPNGGDA